MPGEEKKLEEAKKENHVSAEQVAAVGAKVDSYAEALLALDSAQEARIIPKPQVRIGDKVIQLEAPPREYNNLYLSDCINYHVNMLIKDGKAKPQEPLIFTFGEEVYQVTYFEGAKPEIHVQRKLVEHVPKDERSEDERIKSARLSSAKVVITYQDIAKTYGHPARVMFSVKVEDKVVFTRGAVHPNQLQREVIKKFADQLNSGSHAELAVMGTATGKSFVLAGITHATGEGVYVVPNEALVKEMQKTINLLHGDGTAVLVSDKNMTVEEFKQKWSENKQIIMTADDPHFREKLALIKNRTMLIDEAHEHTFTVERNNALINARNNNIVIAVTGTPNMELVKSIADNDMAMIDVNVARAQREGSVRQVNMVHDKNVKSEDLVFKTLLNYFGRDVYWHEGKGVATTNDIKNMLKEGVEEDDAISKAMAHNLERASMQKNFVFSGSSSDRANVFKAYNEVKNGSYARLEELNAYVTYLRNQARMEEISMIVKELHPEYTPLQVKEAVDKHMDKNLAPPVNIMEEIKVAQQSQIAKTMNAVALSILASAAGKKVDYTDFEEADRKKSLGDFIKKFDLSNLGNMTKEQFHKKMATELSKVFTDLPKAQKRAYQNEIRKLCDRMYDHYKTNRNMENFEFLTGEKVDLSALHASYMRMAQHKRTRGTHSAGILDELRSGLVMHVVSDRSYSTGISIKSVLSVQQVISDAKDSLAHADETMQLQARSIRSKDRGAFVMQIVDKKVNPDQYFTIEQVFSETSGKEAIEYSAKHPKTRPPNSRVDFLGADDVSSSEHERLLNQQSTSMENLIEAPTREITSSTLAFLSENNNPETNENTQNLPAEDKPVEKEENVQEGEALEDIQGLFAEKEQGNSKPTEPKENKTEPKAEPKENKTEPKAAEKAKHEEKSKSEKGHQHKPKHRHERHYDVKTKVQSKALLNLSLMAHHAKKDQHHKEQKAHHQEQPKNYHHKR